ncbi:hypothetical protein E2562_025661 [Oryza meyeriana var. granulata]|uniref:Uncharacterized protein n=1 Tax=Oryza meyeriana var. granulata TaxID=110450 RepID=A0A6G1FCC0_9ORYZ|nr:hypothetical protein E2562_025661 [Oryza meyeriana var. granulata]
MAKKQLYITPQIYNCMCTSYADEKESLNMLWVHTIERGLITKSTNQAANLQEMGCFNSKPNDANAIRRPPWSIGEVAVFIPVLQFASS